MFVLESFEDRNLYQLVAGCNKELKMVLPSVRWDSTEQIFSSKPANVRLELVTGYEIDDFFYQKSDLFALKQHVKGDSVVYGIPGLNGSFCLFDENRAIVNTGPLTRDGFGSEKNYGVILENQQVIQSLKTDYDSLIKRDDVRKIDNKRIRELELAIEKLSGLTDLKHFYESRQIKSLGLTGWTLEIFKCLLKIPNEEFKLSEVYQFEGVLSKAYPGNKHVQAKIRQQLQVLRDMGLVKFLNRGQYRKLPGLAGL